MFALAIPVVIGLALLLGVLLMLPGGELGRGQQSLSQLQQYRAFIYAANRYFEQTAAPPTTTAYGWTAIKGAAPPSLRNSDMPPHWKSVRRPDGSWVACTELAETTLASLPALFPVQTVTSGTATIPVLPSVVSTGSITTLIGNGGASQAGTPSYVVMGQQDAQAAASANLCAGTSMGTTMRAENRRSLQHGIALPDLLLAIAVTGLIVAGSMPLLARNSDDLAAKALADDLKAFKAVAEEHFKANRATYEAAMTDGTGAASLCKIGVNPADGTGGTIANSTTLHTCALDGAMLRFLKVLPVTIKARNAYGESWVAVYRMVYNGTSPTGGVEAIFASASTDGTATAVPANARRYQTARTAAGYLGGNGGAVPDTDREVCVAKRATAIYQVCGDGWKANLSDFVSPAELTVFANRLPG